MKKFLLLAVMFAFSAGAFAQHGDPPPGPPSGTPGGKPAQTPAEIAANQVKFLTVLLDLTQAQQNTATGYFTDAENAKALLEADIEKQEALVVAAVLATPTGDIATPAGKIGTDTAGIATADAAAEALFYKLLTSDQKTKYASFLNGDFVVPGNGKGPGNGHGPGTHGHNGH